MFKPPCSFIYVALPALVLVGCQDTDGNIQANNTNPVVDIVSPQPDSSYNEGEEIVFRGTVQDRDEAPGLLSLTLILGNGEPIIIEPDDAGDWRYVSEPLAVGQYLLEASVKDSHTGLGTASVSFNIDAVNKAPTAEIISPESGVSYLEGESILLTGLVGDDAPPTDLSIQWSSNLQGTLADDGADLGGNVQHLATDLIPGVHRIRLIAGDGEFTITDEVDIEIIDVNVPPDLPQIELSPLTATTNDTLVLTILNEGADEDGDELDYTIHWYENGSLVPELDSRRTIDAALTERGDEWRVEVSAHDGQVSSETATQSIFINNIPPSIATATLSPALAYEYSTISVVVEGESDEDGDLVTYGYAWTVNGAAVEGYSGSTLNGDYFSKGDEVRARVTPTDGIEDGATLQTDPVVIGDAAASGLTIEITPSSPVLSDDLSCQVVDVAVDADGEAVSYRYTWEKNGQTVYEDEVGRDTIAAQETELGDTWTCTITPRSGGQAGEPASDSVGIRAGEGSVIITEVLSDSVWGQSGDYIEIKNISPVAVDISGWVLRDDSGDSHTIDPNGALILASGGLAILGASDDESVNGGIQVDEVWSNFSLDGQSDEVVLEADGTVIDRMTYGGSVGLVVASGTAMNLDPANYDAGLNDASDAWCAATSPMERGAFGTPGAGNDQCACALSDADGDGYGDDASCVVTDCDDSQPTSYPGALETCEDGLDNDCDGSDLLCDCLTTDLDGDGHGTALGCPVDERDCDDDDATSYPGAPELCDDIDNDCDAVIDDGLDQDEDGFRLCPVEGVDEDCDDYDAEVNPAAAETCDLLDNDCNGQIDEGFDADGDGISSCAGDCDDQDQTVYPGGTEICGDDIDQDCNGTDLTCACAETDADGDGYGSGPACEEAVRDCDDLNPNTYPTAPELCDDLDNDCNGSIDEGLDEDGDGYEICDAVNPDCDDTRADVNVDGVEICSDLDADEDCDGLIDEGWDEDGDGYTICGDFSDDDYDCEDDDPAINPGADEICDAIDNNCNGLENEGFPDEYEDEDFMSRNDSKDNALDLGYVIKTFELELTIDRVGDQDWFIFQNSELGAAGSGLRLETQDLGIRVEMWNEYAPDITEIHVQAGHDDFDQTWFPPFPGIPQGGNWFVKVTSTEPFGTTCKKFKVLVYLA